MYACGVTPVCIVRTGSCTVPSRYREYLEALCEDDESGEANQVLSFCCVYGTVASTRQVPRGVYAVDESLTCQSAAGVRFLFVVLAAYDMFCFALSPLSSIDLTVQVPLFTYDNSLLALNAQIAMLDGTAQLWQNSSQWFCLVCRHLLEIGVLRPTTLVHYFFRDDNNNAIALSPFLWEVSGRYKYSAGRSAGLALEIASASWVTIHLDSDDSVLFFSPS